MKRAGKVTRRGMVITLVLMNTIACSTLVFAQERIHDIDSIEYRFEIEAGTDNDFFVPFTKTDKYYTYGLRLGFRYVPKQTGFLSRVSPSSKRYFLHFAMNLKAFTPNYLENTPDQILRRPFAGWLYGELNTTHTFQNAVLRVGLQAGVLGPAAHAGDIQNWFHKHVTGDPVLEGWDKQIPNQAGINMVASYSTRLLGGHFWDGYMTARGAVGNIYTYFAPQINFRIGRFLPISQSLALHNSILSPSDAHELFFEIGPGIRLTAYDATLQGNLFRENAFLNAEQVNNISLTARMSVNYSKNRWSGQINYHYSSGDINNNDGHFFGRILMAYRL